MATLKNDSAVQNTKNEVIIVTLVNEQIKIIDNTDKCFVKFVFLPQENELKNPYGADIHTTHYSNICK